MTDDRVEEFKNDTYADSNTMFCKFCQHSIDHNRVHTIQTHLQSEKHKSNKSKAEKEAKKGSSSSCQLSIELAMKSA